MFRIDPLSRQPVYEQLIDQMEKLVIAGILPPGTQLPSVRGLSVELSINPNTIQKAYSELDGKGIIYSVSGVGCFISPDAPALLKEHARGKLPQLGALATELVSAGVDEEEILAYIRDTLKERRK